MAEVSFVLNVSSIGGISRSAFAVVVFETISMRIISALFHLRNLRLSELRHKAECKRPLLIPHVPYRKNNINRNMEIYLFK